MTKMKIAVLADDIIRKEWESKVMAPGILVEWAGSMRILTACSADAYFDLMYEDDPERAEKLLMRADKPIFVNAVTETIKKIGHDFVRINAWPGFLCRPIAELSLPKPEHERVVHGIMESMGWAYQLVPDIPGMISARIIAAIINEAYYTWGEGISSKEDIDVAMKLGTNYPMGPFEWSRKIGLQRLYNLLYRLSLTDERYEIAPALAAEVHAVTTENKV